MDHHKKFGAILFTETGVMNFWKLSLFLFVKSWKMVPDTIFWGVRGSKMVHGADLWPSEVSEIITRAIETKNGVPKILAKNVYRQRQLRQQRGGLQPGKVFWIASERQGDGLHLTVTYITFWHIELKLAILELVQLLRGCVITITYEEITS